MSEGTILIVDDEELIRWSLAEELKSAGYETVEAGTVKQAREVAEGIDPDLCILDIRLPDGTGVDLLRELRARDAELPIVMITGHGNIALAIEVTRLGATEYIPKPFDLREMLLVVERAIRTARQGREL